MKLRLRQLLSALVFVGAVALGTVAVVMFLGLVEELRDSPGRLFATALVASSLIAGAAVAAFLLWRRR